MFNIMSLYYSPVDRDQFEKDLREKTKIILLLGPQSEILGFSTILVQELLVLGRKILAIYSGDTVLDRDHWGNGALGRAFGRFLLQTKLKNPWVPCYWFLISKGYKTYLLMANNFPKHFPRFECPTPPFERAAMDQFYGSKFGASYISEKNWILPQGNSYALRVSVADIDYGLLKIPRISFFVERNPQWQKGYELTCIAHVSLWVPFRYFLKRTIKRFSTKPAKEASHALH